MIAPSYFLPAKVLFLTTLLLQLSLHVQSSIQQSTIIYELPLNRPTALQASRRRSSLRNLNFSSSATSDTPDIKSNLSS